MKTAEPFYKKGRWLTLRRAVLARDGYMCAECRRYGRRKDAVTVHHIFTRDEFPEFEWSGWNLTSLCKKCHDEMHDRTTNALTDRGVRLLIRTAKRRGMDVPLRYRE